MDWTFQQFDARKVGRDRLYDELHRIYQHLMLATGADVDESLRWLKSLGERHGWFEQWSFEEFRERLLQDGEIEKTKGGSLQLTPRGEIRIRKDSLARVFAGLTRTGGMGEHRTGKSGAGGVRERLPETRRFQSGDELADLDWQASTRNAVRRIGGGPLRYEEEDLEVFETEVSTSCATVIAIDVSHSMTLYGEDRITPAKQVSLALVELIRTRYPRDDVSVITFGDRARQIEIPQIVHLTNGPFHTNTREGLELAAQILSRKKQPNKQVFLVTDGKPSCLTENGRLYKNPFGLDEKVVNKTLEMAAVLRGRNVVVSTFMLTDDPMLVQFVEDFTRLNKGRAYYSRADELGSFLFVDYLRNRRRRVH